MDVSVNRVDEANVELKGQITKDELNKKIDELAKKTGKQIKVDGFRKGKVPASVVKKLYGQQLNEDAEGELVREMLEKAKKEAEISDSDMLGEPIFKKYQKDDEKIDVEIVICLNPNVNVDGYKDVIPSYETPEVTDEEVEKELENIAKANATTKEVTEDRELQNGDIAVIDFEGFLDGEPFEGGKAENYELEIGSNSFVGNFEEQLVGMKKGETREIEVTFPEDYQSEQLKGKTTKFNVTLKDIKEKVIPAIDDELAKVALKKDDVTLEDLKKDVKKSLTQAKLGKIYEDELKPKLLETLVEKFEFALPQNIVEQEIDNLANQKAQSLSKEELEKIQGNQEEIDKLRESVREDATNSVKATFIVDAIAKAENVTIDDNELYQTIYYEALMSGQDPQAVIKYYEKNNLLPALKMGMIEDKLFVKLFDFDSKVESI